MKVRYTYKLRPGKQALTALKQEWDKSRYVWNICVEDFNNFKPTGYAYLCRKITQVRAENTWLADGSSHAQYQTVRTFDQAKNQFFRIKKRNRPKFKSKKKSLPTLQYTKQYYKIKEGKLKLAKVPAIPIVWSRNLPSKPSSVRVYCTCTGDWFASFVVDIKPIPLPPVNKAIGFDPGLITPITSTDPEMNFDFISRIKTKDYKRGKYQRMMNRRFKRGVNKQSNKYEKAKIKAAKANKKIANQRKEHIREWAQKVCHKYDHIALENINLSFLNKNKHFSSKTYDISFGILKKELELCAKKHGREFKLVKPHFSSVTCSFCGQRNNDHIDIEDRLFVCEHCDFKFDRDVNAARNMILWAGFNPSSIKNIYPPLPIEG